MYGNIVGCEMKNNYSGDYFVIVVVYSLVHDAPPGGEC